MALPLLVAAFGFAAASLVRSDLLALIALSLAVIGIYPSLSPLIGFAGLCEGRDGTVDDELHRKRGENDAEQSRQHDISGGAGA